MYIFFFLAFYMCLISVLCLEVLNAHPLPTHSSCIMGGTSIHENAVSSDPPVTSFFVYWTRNGRHIFPPIPDTHHCFHSSWRYCFYQIEGTFLTTSHKGLVNADFLFWASGKVRVGGGGSGLGLIDRDKMMDCSVSCRLNPSCLWKDYHTVR